MEETTQVAEAPIVPKKRYTIRPRHEWVLVKRITQDEEILKVDKGDGTFGEVVIDKSQRRSLRASVVDFGDKVHGLSIGDEVLISAFGMEMPDIEELTGEKDLLMLRDEECYCTAHPRPE